MGPLRSPWEKPHSAPIVPLPDGACLLWGVWGGGLAKDMALVGHSEEGSGDSSATWGLLQAPPTPLAPSYSHRSHSPSPILAHPPLVVAMISVGLSQCSAQAGSPFGKHLLAHSPGLQVEELSPCPPQAP